MPDTDPTWLPVLRKRQHGVVNGHANGQVNGHTNGHANGLTNGYSSEDVNADPTTEPGTREPPPPKRTKRGRPRVETRTENAAEVSSPVYRPDTGLRRRSTSLNIPVWLLWLVLITALETQGPDKAGTASLPPAQGGHYPASLGKGGSTHQHGQKHRSHSRPLGKSSANV